MLKNEVTAQHLAAQPKDFTRYRFYMKSPFSGKVCYIIGAEKSGKRVTLITEDNCTLFVEATRKISKEKLKK